MPQSERKSFCKMLFIFHNRNVPLAIEENNDSYCLQNAIILPINPKGITHGTLCNRQDEPEGQRDSLLAWNYRGTSRTPTTSVKSVQNLPGVNKRRCCSL